MTVGWDFDTVHQLMANSDIGIIPVDMEHEPLPGQTVSSWQVRSENRLTMKMAVGLPVIASPVPSYLPVVQQGKNGFIATTRDEWLAFFEELRDPRRREEIGRSARESVLRKYSKEEQARKLLAVLDRVKEEYANV